MAGHAVIVGITCPYRRIRLVIFPFRELYLGGFLMHPDGKISGSKNRGSQGKKQRRKHYTGTIVMG